MNYEEMVVQLPLLQAMDESVRAQLAGVMVQNAEVAEFGDGEVLVEEGALGGSTGYVLVKGTVFIQREGHEDLRASAPLLIGEMQQFDPKSQRTATVVAFGPVVALRVQWQTLYTQIRRNLPQEVQTAFLVALERQILERLNEETLLDIALWRPLPSPLKMTACLLLHWIGEPVAVSEGAFLFHRGDLCSGYGYLLLRGNLALRNAAGEVAFCAAPNLVGVFTRFNPDLQWSADVVARDDVQVLRFHWPNFLALLRQRLSSDDMTQFVQRVESCREHFMR